MLDFINSIKNDFQQDIYLQDPKNKQLKKLLGEKVLIENRAAIGDLFEKLSDKDIEQDLSKISRKINQLEQEINDTKNNIIYQNAFEWRFEFPEVLDEEGDFVGFDVVIGNPPYINFRDIKEKSLKNHLNKTFKVAEYQSDLFILFIEQSYKLLNFSGLFGYIIPNTIANNLNNSNIRKFILENSSITSIVDTPIGTFPDATVDTIVLISNLNIQSDNELTSLITDGKSFKLFSRISQNTFKENGNYYFDFLTSNTVRNVLKKIENNTIELNEISNSSSGIKEYEVGKGKPPQTKEDRIDKIFNSNKRLDNNYRSHITGSNIKHYVINWTGQYLKYGKWIAAPRSSIFFKGERVVIREIPEKKRLIAAFTDKNYTIKNTAHIFIPNEEFSSKFLVGIINSNLIGFYFINKFSERDDVFPKAKIGQCRLLPIKSSTKAAQQPIINLVTEILAQKQADPKADTSELETAIDALVYELYDLTAAEIALIEKG
jgi:hypothetical protein